MQPSSVRISDFLWLIVIGVLLFGAFIGSYHLITPDEGRYVEVAREMVASNNFITPYLNGSAFLDKPILYYWFEGLLIKTFGLSEWSVRILPAFFGLLGWLFVYWAGCRLYNRRTGWLGALILMSGSLYFLSAHYADMDLMVAVLLSGAFWFFIVATQILSARRNYYYWGAYFFAALAFLTKGLMGIVFPALIIGLWIFCLWRWRTLLQMRLISGLILFLIIVLPWFVLVQQANPEFLNYFFVIQQFSRYLTSDFNMHKPVYFYLVVIFAGFLPWTLFLFQAISQMVLYVKQQWKKAEVELFLLLWVGVILVFFSIPQSKIIGYILPVFPPLAMITARYFDKNWMSLPQSVNLKTCGFIMLFLGIVLSLAMIVIAHIPGLINPLSVIYLSIIAIVILVGSAITVYFSFYRTQLTATFLAILLTMVCANVTIIAGAYTFKLATVKPLALYLNQVMPADAVVVSYHSYYQDLPVYLQRKVYVVYNWDDPTIIQHDNWRRQLAEDILYKHYRQPYLINDQELITLWQSHLTFVIIDAGKLSGFEKLVNSPVYVIQRYDKFLLLSNKRG